ncbi:lysophospholipid acyltransferase family protein [Calorimonas adulescens]|nr:lysophospholipid acyltransferase family protein [Calorimonas adulescens]
MPIYIYYPMLIFSKMPSFIRTPIIRVILEFYLKKYIKLEVYNKEILEEMKGKPALYICNHLSNMDAILLNKVLKKNRVAFIAGVKLTRNIITYQVMQTVRTIKITPNTADVGAIKAAIDYLKKGGSILIFPEGTRSRVRSMIEAKPGFAVIASKANVPVVPIGIEGVDDIFPINDNDIGKEFFKKRGTAKITIGKPFYIDKQGENEDRDQWLRRITNDAMYRIAALVSPRYRGVYSKENAN